LTVPLSGRTEKGANDKCLLNSPLISGQAVARLEGLPTPALVEICIGLEINGYHRPNSDPRRILLK
jgi:hypothetical protein